MKDNLENIINDVYSTADLSTTQSCVCNCCKIAMPQINYCEFLNIAASYWSKASQENKLTILSTSIDYFFKVQFEKFGIETLVKPCVFLDKKDNLCTIYDKRPLSCRMYGLWPKEEFEKRVSRFEKAYSSFGLSREDLPLSSQCDKVTRKDSSVELTVDIIDGMYDELNKIDKSIKKYTDLQIEGGENKRTFHDWLLASTFGEEWLSLLSTFILTATREQISELIIAIKLEVSNNKQKLLGDSFQ